VNLIPGNIINQHPALKEWNILLGYRGSIAHGMYIPNSDPNSIDDIDLMGICIPPKDYYFGLKSYGSRGTQEIKENEWDIVVYEFKKFISLLSKGNPNVMSMLWLDDYLHISEEGKALRDQRDLFVGKHVYHSFSGYAHAQLHKMAHFAFNGYMGEKRKGLVNKFGYDTKNAAHLIRLLRMCIEFLQDGVFRVKRQDAEELLKIKRGEWTLDQVKAEGESLFELAKEAYEKSPLPEELDHEKINKLCCTILEMRFGRSDAGN